MDVALVEANAGLAEHADVLVPALYSRLGDRPLWSERDEGRQLTPAEIEHGIGRLKVGELERYEDPVALATMRAVKAALLTGDSVHCFGDGILIASAFMADLRLGVIASLAVLAHEVPHHMGDLVVLRGGSPNQRMALIKVSMAGAVTALGGLVGYLLVDALHDFLPYFLVVASSSFVYVALADLIPQLQKRLSARQTAAPLAEPLQAICAAREVAFIVNDSISLAKRLGADGVHLGQGDGALADARERLGREAQIGVTCNASRHLGLEAGEGGADYVAFGAFFPSETKATEHRAGLDLLEWWQAVMEIPCVAIGGITAANCAPLVQAGADFLAVSGGVWNGDEAANVRALAEAIAAA